MAAFAVDNDCPTPTVSGSASAPGTKIPGAPFSNILPGHYMAVATGYIRADYASSTTTCTFALNDGTTTSGWASVAAFSGATSVAAPTIVGYFTYTSLQPSVTIQLYAMRVAGGGSCLIANDIAASNQFEITLVPLDQGRPAPLLVNSVVSSYAGVARTEWTKVEAACSSTPCTIVSQSGGVSSISRASTGDYTINFSPNFSVAPICTIIPYQASVFARIQTSAVGAYNFRTYSVGTTPTLTDSSFDIACFGAR
jgi:hypothetical protein